MAEQDISDLVEKVGDLTSATTELLGEVNVSKTKLDNAEKTATESAARAKTDAATATTKAAEAKISEQNAKKSADSAAKVVTGGTATLDPEGGKIPLADAKGKIHHGWLPDQGIPFPDFWLPLNDSLQILAGEGKHDQIDVSAAQDGSKMVDLPTKSAKFSRATTATYIDKSGVLRTAGVNEPRFEKDGILIEGSSTNLISKSSSTTWTDNNTGKGEGTLEANEDYQTKGIIPQVNRRLADKNTPYHSPVMEVGQIYTLTIRFMSDIDGDDIGIINGGLTGRKKAPFKANTWTTVSVTGEATSPSISFRVPCEKSVDIVYFQLEKLPFASSYIPTDGSPVTRAGDKLTSPLPLTQPFTYSATFKEIGVFGSYNVILGISGSRPRLERTGNYINSIFKKINGVQGSASINFPSDMLRNNATTITSVNTHDYVSLYVGDLKATSNNGDFSEIDGGIYISDSNANSWWGHIKNLRIWGKALTDAQIAALGAAK